MTKELPDEWYGFCPVCGKRGWSEPDEPNQCNTCGTRFTVTNWDYEANSSDESYEPDMAQSGLSRTTNESN